MVETERSSYSNAFTDAKSICQLCHYMSLWCLSINNPLLFSSALLNQLSNLCTFAWKLITPFNQQWTHNVSEHHSPWLWTAGIFSILVQIRCNEISSPDRILRNLLRIKCSKSRVADYMQQNFVQKRCNKISIQIICSRFLFWIRYKEVSFLKICKQILFRITYNKVSFQIRCNKFMSGQVALKFYYPKYVSLSSLCLDGEEVKCFGPKQHLAFASALALCRNEKCELSVKLTLQRFFHHQVNGGGATKHWLLNFLPGRGSRRAPQLINLGGWKAKKLANMNS